MRQIACHREPSVDKKVCQCKLTHAIDLSEAVRPHQTPHVRQRIQGYRIIQQLYNEPLVLSRTHRILTC